MATPPMRAASSSKCVAAKFRNFVEDRNRFVGDFGADAVAGRNQYLQLHFSLFKYSEARSHDRDQLFATQLEHSPACER